MVVFHVNAKFSNGVGFLPLLPDGVTWVRRFSVDLHAGGHLAGYILLKKNLLLNEVLSARGDFLFLK